MLFLWRGLFTFSVTLSCERLPRCLQLSVFPYCFFRFLLFLLFFNMLRVIVCLNYSQN